MKVIKKNIGVKKAKSNSIPITLNHSCALVLHEKTKSCFIPLNQFHYCCTVTQKSLFWSF